MKITHWHKGEEPVPVPELDEFFGRFMRPFEGDRVTRLPETFRRRGVPPINVAEAEDHYAISVELPGLHEEDIRVELMGNQLMISGERKWEEEKKDKEYHRVESQYGSFQRAIQLPSGLQLDPAAVDAKYEKGMLEIRIPKVEPTPVSRIQVKKG